MDVVVFIHDDDDDDGSSRPMFPVQIFSLFFSLKKKHYWLWNCFFFGHHHHHHQWIPEWPRQFVVVVFFWLIKNYKLTLDKEKQITSGNFVCNIDLDLDLAVPFLFFFDYYEGVCMYVSDIYENRGYPKKKKY